jgi:hypothetical protein
MEDEKSDTMNAYYFTCGQSHSHDTGGGKVWNKASVLQVNAESERLAREKVFSLFGDNWSMCYGPDDISMEYYPNGICNIISA